jgi:hypothetical protein
MRETEFKEIDGVKYSCDMMPATKAQATLIRLVETLGRPVVVALAKGASGGNFGDAELDDLAQVGTSILFERLTPENADRIIKDAFHGVRAEGVGEVAQDKIFDGHFKGRLMHMYRVFGWAVEVNYRDFFDAARGNRLLGSLRARVESAVSQQTSTPGSGEPLLTETH